MTTKIEIEKDIYEYCGDDGGYYDDQLFKPYYAGSMYFIDYNSHKDFRKIGTIKVNIEIEDDGEDTKFYLPAMKKYLTDIIENI